MILHLLHTGPNSIRPDTFHIQFQYRHEVLLLEVRSVHNPALQTNRKIYIKCYHLKNEKHDYLKLNFIDFVMVTLPIGIIVNSFNTISTDGSPKTTNVDDRNGIDDWWGHNSDVFSPVDAFCKVNWISV